jgi:hypothetical protein
MLWRLYEDYNGRPPWDILKNYSEYCRSIVEKGRELRRQANNSAKPPESEDFELAPAS